MILERNGHLFVCVCLFLCFFNILFSSFLILFLIFNLSLRKLYWLYILMYFGWVGVECVYIETICNFLFFTEYIMYGLVKIPIK